MYLKWLNPPYLLICAEQEASRYAARHEIAVVADREKPDEDAAEQYEQIYIKYQQAAKLLGEWAQ